MVCVWLDVMLDFREIFVRFVSFKNIYGNKIVYLYDVKYKMLD